MGAYSAPPDILAGFKGSASQQLEERAEWTGQERRGGEEGEEKNGDMGRDGEERDDVDFATSCKNSCGRPCQASRSRGQGRTNGLKTKAWPR